MRQLPFPNFAATVLFAVFFLVANVGAALYAATNREPSGSFRFLYYVGSGAVVAYWLHADKQRLRQQEFVDEGWFMLWVWPIALPYHLFKTRGSRGAVTPLGLIGLYAVTYVISMIVFYMAYGEGVE